ncbi:MAG: trimethylamine methyltransferase family protein [Geminicoccaceae bacterium]|nr:trimethylamine methyltransferase family protein [Geminicoccaceae bacterium]
MAERERRSERALRRGAGSARGGARIEQRRLRNPFPPIRILSDDQVEAIHGAALRILKEIGVRVLHDGARSLFRAAGAEVDDGGRMVRLDGDLIAGLLAQAPPTLTLKGGSPERAVRVGGDAVAFGTVGGPPHASDLKGGRRPGTLEDFKNLMRLGQSFDVIHLLNPAVEPLDVPPRTRHLDLTLYQLLLSDKVPFVFCRGAQAVADCLEMVRVGRGLTHEAFRDTPCAYTVVNTNSPLQIDALMAQGIVDFALAGQLVIVTPFTLAGAMAPISLAGALAQQHAEAMAGIALAQAVRPGAPVAYGAFTSNVDMKSGAPAFGTPEYVKAAFASGQLARRLNLPWRSSNVNASNAPDAQAAYESQMSLWGAVMGGANLVMHGAGWLEGGLTASFEKFVIDVEMLQMFAALFTPLTVNEAELALDAVREAGPGGHYFATAHTLERYEHAFYAPLLSDWRNFGQWTEYGAKDAAARAHEIAFRTLEAFEPPPVDPGVREELEAFAARRRKEGGAAVDG